MNRFAGTFALLTVLTAPDVHAEQLILHFEGIITEVKDANALDPNNPNQLLDLNFPPIPVNSTFSGTVTYDTTSPLTDINIPGFARYLDLLSSAGSLTVNGITFATTDSQSVSAQVSSQEANVRFSGVNYVNSDLTVPQDWDITSALNPYFTLQFWDATPQTRSLALPSSAEEIPTDVMRLVLDFRQSVIIDGQTYGERVFVRGQVTAISVNPPPPPQQVAIDVAPGSANNKVNLNTKNPKPLEVAVFGAPGFDVLDVVQETIVLGDPVLTAPGAGTGQKISPTDIAAVDVNGDGELDLLLTFDVLHLQNFGAIDHSSTSLQLEALLDNDGVVFGSDVVSIPGGKGKGK